MMLRIHQPDETEIRQLMQQQSQLAFTYRELGATENKILPAGFRENRYAESMGSGREIFDHACQLLESWQWLNHGWVEGFVQGRPASGDMVGVLARLQGFWSLNFCRIVYVNRPTAQSNQFSMAVGTLPEHAACGEERVSVSWSPDTDDVEFEIRSFSRPHQPAAQIGRWFVYYLQRRFVRDSAASMRSGLWELTRTTGSENLAKSRL